MSVEKYIAGKFDSLKLIIPGNLDKIVICESKLDNPYPNSHFSLVGFSVPFRLDKLSRGWYPCICSGRYPM